MKKKKIIIKIKDIYILNEIFSFLNFETYFKQIWTFMLTQQTIPPLSLFKKCVLPAQAVHSFFYELKNKGIIEYILLKNTQILKDVVVCYGNMKCFLKLNKSMVLTEEEVLRFLIAYFRFFYSSDKIEKIKRIFQMIPKVETRNYLLVKKLLQYKQSYPYLIQIIYKSKLFPYVQAPIAIFYVYFKKYKHQMYIRFLESPEYAKTWIYELFYFSNAWIPYIATEMTDFLFLIEDSLYKTFAYTKDKKEEILSTIKKKQWKKFISKIQNILYMYNKPCLCGLVNT
jgi:hypothetical protein